MTQPRAGDAPRDTDVVTVAKPTNVIGECTERDERAAMTDGEFWEHVAISLGQRPPDDFDPEELGYDPDSLVLGPCDICGETGACGYDAEGRVLVHLVEPDDENEED